MAFSAGSGHYGILRFDGNQIGGFIQWGIGVSIGTKTVPAKWIASAREWWLTSDIADNKCEASFYKIIDDREILLACEQIVFKCGSREKNKLIKSLFEMQKQT